MKLGYEDFLKQHNLQLWDKNDQRVINESPAKPIIKH